MAPSSAHGEGASTGITTLDSTSTKRKVQIDVRLRLHPASTLKTNRHPVFYTEDPQAQALIQSVEATVRESLFIENAILPPCTQARAIKLPAYIAPSPYPKNRTSENSQASASSTSESDQPMDTNNENGRSLPIPNAYFESDQIRICVNSNAAYKDIDRVSFLLAEMQTRLYHPRPTACTPRLPKVLQELTSAHPLPHAADDSLWESLQHDAGHKAILLTYVSTRKMLARSQVDANIICGNGMVLLHGPPGTGKTSLCRAVAHQAAVRSGQVGVFLHARMDTLVSKWFGESAKKTGALFRAVRKLAHSVQLLILLLDEVESVAMVRSVGGAGSEAKDPGDGIRLVNAMLTGLDAVSKFDNVVVMATSNFANGIDDAFADRADLVLYVDVPGVSVVRNIVVRCVRELVRAGVICKVNPDGEGDGDGGVVGSEHEACMSVICRQVCGLSARQICKLPIAALTMGGGEDAVPFQMGSFLKHLRSCCHSSGRHKSEFQL